MAVIIDGKAKAQKMKEELKKRVENHVIEGNVPTLAVVLVGDDPASRVYVNSKKKSCEYIGIRSLEILLSEKATEEELLKVVKDLNNDESVNGILVQLPLPRQINEENILNAIDPLKDVDCFNPENVGKVLTGGARYFPCTPGGIMELLDEYGIDVGGKDCVVVGRSNIVGKPISMLLLHKNATVTICHSKTKDLKEVCRRADILVAAVGRPEMITGEYIKPGAVVIDVGINRINDKTLVGDVKFDEAVEIASYITPVPGGVGVMTPAVLMKNTVKAFEIQKSYRK